MFFWFIATSVWSVWFVFRDPKFDYRLVAIAALVPDLVDGLWGIVGPFHSAVTSIAVLFAIMIGTAGRKPIRQRLLAVPIGLFIHLIFDGAFSNSKSFWWPISGFSFGENKIPSIERGLINLPLELLGMVGCFVAWKYFGLGDNSRRKIFFANGSLSAKSEG